IPPCRKAPIRSGRCSASREVLPRKSSTAFAGDSSLLAPRWENPRRYSRDLIKLKHWRESKPWPTKQKEHHRQSPRLPEAQPRQPLEPLQPEQEQLPPLPLLTKSRSKISPKSSCASAR